MRDARRFSKRRDGGSSVRVKTALGLADAVFGLNHPLVIFLFFIFCLP